jgi:hypothetical protein
MKPSDSHMTTEQTNRRQTGVWYYIPEDITLHNHHCENIKSYRLQLAFMQWHPDLSVIQAESPCTEYPQTLNTENFHQNFGIFKAEDKSSHIYTRANQSFRQNTKWQIGKNAESVTAAACYKAEENFLLPLFKDTKIRQNLYGMCCQDLG